jgi:hypothetical protein
VMGLSAGAVSDYAALSAAVRFNPAGTIDVINGPSAYNALTAVPYTAGASYRFRMVVNPAAGTYSAYVTPPAASEVQIANNYAFRTSAPFLSNRALISEIGTAQVCNFGVGGVSASACDCNNDGTVNVTDVQLSVNQAIGAAACTDDINQDGQCNVIDVQRVVNAALGGTCVTP